MVETSCAVSWRLPSPVKTTTRRGLGDSSAANNAPSVEPPAQPILPHRTCETNVAPFGNGVPTMPNDEVPVSATTTSSSRRNWPIIGQNAA